MKKYILFLLLLPSLCYSQIIISVAGGGSMLGDGGAAISALIDNPTGVIFNKKGDLYIATGFGNRIRKIDTFGIITTIAGTGIAGYTGDNGPATAAQLNFASDIALDTSGNIYFTQNFNPAVRRIDALTGIITTICGNGISAYTGDNGPATAAQVYAPNGICIDNHNNIYISDNNVHRVRMINPSGIIASVAGTGIYGYNGDGIQATSAQLYFPTGLTNDDMGNLYISDQGNGRIRKVDTSGIISTYAGNGNLTYSGDGMLATNAQFTPSLLRFDWGQNLYFTAAPSRVFKIDNSGIFHTIAGTGIAMNTGDGGPATAASIKGPVGLAFDKCGNLYIGNVAASGDSDKIRKITFNTSCVPVAVNDVPQYHPISVFPNPASTQLHIENLGAAAAYRILDMVGTVEQYGSLSAGSNTLDIEALPQGVYLVEVSGENGRQVSRVVKR